MKKIFIYLLLFYSGTMPLLSNTFFDYYKQISIEQGLTQSTGNCIFRDSKGLLWIGTRNGLNKLEANQIINYFSDNKNSASLPGNHINLILEDSLNNIWISTDGGLAIYNHDNFTKISDETFFSGLKVNDGVIFGGTNSIYKYCYSDKSFRKIELSALNKNNIGISIVSNMLLRTQDEIIISTSSGDIFRFYPKLNKADRIPVGEDKYMIMSICLDKDTLYVSFYKKGVKAFDLEGKLINEYSVENKRLSNNIVCDIKKWNDKILMATDGGGINVLNPAKNNISQINFVAGNNGFVSIASIISLYVDDHNNLWAGTVHDGVFNLKKTFIHTYSNISKENVCSVNNKAVISLFEDNDGMLWIGTDGDGIKKYNPGEDKFTFYESTTNDKIVSITDLSADELLVSVYTKGLFTFNKKTGRYKEFLFVNEEINRQMLFSGYVSFSHRVSSDKIYILSNNSYIYYPERKKFKPLKTFDDNTIPDGLTLMYSDKKVSYVVNSTYQNIIYQIAQEDDKVRLFFSLAQDEVINSLAVDEENRLMWIATNNGLYRLDMDSQDIRHFQTNLFRNISYLYLENSDRIWICARNMLFLYLIKQNQYIIWSESDGFMPNEILSTYQKKSNENNIYLGGSKGFVRIEKNIPIEKTTTSEINLLDFLFNGKSYYSNQLNNTDKKTFKIPWDYTSLVIKVNLNESDIFRKTLFHYTIVGQNNKYEVESDDNTLNLPSLSPDKYSIFVSCTTKDGEWSPSSELIKMEIIPPWYKNSIFIYGLIFIISGFILGLASYIVKRKENKLKWKMKEHEQALNKDKMQFLININHELRTPLTLIYAPLKRILDKGQIESPLVEKKLKNIFNQTKQMLSLINMVLDLSRFESKKMELNIQPHILNNWLQTVIDNFSDEFKEKDILIETSFDDGIGIVYLDEARCNIVMFNLLINAFKFSEPHTVVKVCTSINGEFIRISVTDEGIGLKDIDTNLLFTRFYQGNNKKKGSGIGLSYVKDLIEQHKGNVGAYDNQHKGATFYFELPAVPSFPVEESVLSAHTQPPICQPAPDEDSFPNDLLSNYTILVVDDTESFRTFLLESLQDSFKVVYTAGNGAEALEIIHKKNPDIIVSDVMMPEMDGFELCRKVKSDISISHIPVVLLTAWINEYSVNAGYKTGADFYLPKPFDVDFLITITKNILWNRELVKTRFKQSIPILSEKDNTYSNADEKFMQKLNSLIRENLNNPELNVQYLARETAMSRSSLYNKIKVLTGMGVNDYINKFRIERAIWLLANTDMSITNITYEIGYMYQRYFSMIFKKSTGYSPTQYRDKYSSKI